MPQLSTYTFQHKYTQFGPALQVDAPIGGKPLSFEIALTQFKLTKLDLS